MQAHQIQDLQVQGKQVIIHQVIIKLQTQLLGIEDRKTTSQTNNVQTNNNNAETNNQQEIISQNVNLKELHLNVEGISPSFNKDILEYYLVVSNFINNIEVDAKPEEQTANVSITGNNNLVLGNNKIEIVVTSKDSKNSKKYVINVSKLQDKNIGNASLENLAIENVAIIPEFSSDILSYSAEVDSNIESINILAVPQNEKATVEIYGNNNLQIGDNFVEIKVIAEDENTIKNYNILVHKKNKQEEQTEDESKEVLNKTKEDIKKHENKYYLWIIFIIFLIILVSIIAFIIWKKRQNKKEK